ncbi:DUF2968 domain-containing protein [Paraburkholderia sp. BR14262]|uniref:DUF2968 domain-containing protein n=1 Tax=Paraburkholderia sp. BR14262 TaxID=3236999 RepID=UPI0034CD5968
MSPESGDAVSAVAPARGVTVVSLQAGTRSVQMADVSLVERLGAEKALVQFRLFRSFDYSAVLSFHGENQEFYVELYQEQILWRAFVAPDLESAEAAFRYVQEQIVRMTDGEVRRARLKAQNERLSKMIAETEAQAERLRSDIERDATQTQLVNARQHEVRKELAQLEAQRVAAQAQLNKAARYVQNLRLTNSETVPHLNTRRDDATRK